MPPTITRWIGSLVNRDPAAPRNDGLVRTMAEVGRSDTPATRAIFYQAILGSRLLAVRPGDAPEKHLEVITGPAEPFGFQMLPAPQGKRAVAIYTDVDTLIAGNPNAKGFVAFEPRPLFEAVSGADGGVMINYGSRNFAHILQDDVKSLSRGEIPASAKVAQFTQPVVPDAETMEILRSAMAEDPRILSANFFATQVQGEPARNACGVKFSPEVTASDMDLGMRKMISRVARTMTGAENFDFVLLNRAGPLSRAEGMFPPFYTRATP